ncbi:MAG: cytochrome c oxidase subunit II [Polyangiaceae bacterium]|jgi:cytochrome c oxidase subunit II
MNEQNAPATYQLPPQMSTVAAEVDWLYYFIYWLSVVLFVAIVGAMIYWAIKYRERPGHKAEPTGHNLPLELAWTIAPIFILVFLFHKGFQGYLDMTIAPPNAIEIRVNAKQWSWEFVYPNGGSSDKLHVPVHKPVKLVMASADVLHSFFVPALRIKRDVVPGMYTTVWFEATQTGKDDIACAEYCGGRSEGPGGELPYEPTNDPDNPYVSGQMTGHWAMHSRVYVELQEDFDKFVKSIGDKCDAYRSEGKICPGEVAAAEGQKLSVSKGCVACHTTTGMRLVGPSWKDIWGKEESTDKGDVLVDENYIRESILAPQAKIVTGFQAVMPTFSGQISDPEIDELIAYIKSLK